MIFQSLGSNYSFGQAIRLLFMRGKLSDSVALRTALETRYGGKAVLYSKGRGALAAAVAMTADGNDAVALNSLTCSVVVDAVIDAGATPVFLDVAKKTGHFGATTLEKAAKTDSRISTVIIQNTYGQPCDIAKIEKAAVANGLYIIEDLAHAVGRYYPDGREIGTVGDAAMLSFGRDKILDAVNGGALIVRNKRLLGNLDCPDKLPPSRKQLRDRVYPLLTWIIRTTYAVGIGKLLHFVVHRLRIARQAADGRIRRSETMPDWQAKFALSRFSELEQEITRRTNLISDYQTVLKSTLINPEGTIRASFLVKNQAATHDRLRRENIQADDTWYDTPIGPARKYKRYDFPEKKCPNAMHVSRHVINLPTHRYIDTKTAIKIAKLVEKDSL
jgi:dTDP-4-amino-4,6-dideoxygalactose transaminase